MWPAAFWEKLYEPLIRRAAGLGRAAGAEDPDHYEKAFALLRRAGDRLRARPGCRRRSRPARRRARHPVRGGFRARRPAAVRAAEIDGLEGHDWAARAEAELDEPAGGAGHAPHDACSASTTTAPTARSSASSIISRRRRSMSRASAPGGSSRSARSLAAGAIERPIVFAGNDRPGRDAGRRRAHLSQPLRRRAGAPRGRLHQQRRRLAHGRRSRARRRRGCGRGRGPRRRRRGRGGAGAGRARHARRAKSSRRTAPDARGRRRCATRPGASSAIACDLARRVRRLESDASTSPAISAASRSGTRRIAAFVPGALPPGMAVAGAASGRLTLADALADGARARRRGGGRLRLRDAAGARAVGDAGAERIDAALAGAGQARQGVRRLPERRHRDGRDARRIARASARSST